MVVVQVFAVGAFDGIAAASIEAQGQQKHSLSHQATVQTYSSAALSSHSFTRSILANVPADSADFVE